MSAALTAFVATLVALLPITNPIGALAAYAGLTGDTDPHAVSRMSWKVGIYVCAILGVFAVIGTEILQAFGITLAALQIGGGIVVAWSAWGMLGMRENMAPAEKEHAATKGDISFTPMALPLVAGPGAIGVVIALAARHPGLGARVGIVAGVAVLAVLIAVLLRFGTPLVDHLGPTGIGALTRIIGFLVLVIGVESVIHGIQAVGPPSS